MSAYWRYLAAVAVCLLVVAAASAASTLDLYFIDVEGGQATLVVSPSGQSMLVDTGWGGFNGRDADLIAAAAKKAGVKALDFVVITHYHDDHVGGLEQLAARLKFRTIVTHGANTETTPNAARLSAVYANGVKLGGGVERAVRPGETFKLDPVEVKIVASNREVVSSPGGSSPANPLCAGAVRAQPDRSDNSASVGMLLTFGRFRFLDLGDLTQDLEFDLACPVNRVGAVDLYLSTHHGSAASGAEVLVHALKPRVAIMNNGSRKGGDLGPLQVIRRAPGLEDLWMLHYAVAAADGNVAEPYIANMRESPDSATHDAGFGIKVSAGADGSFTVTNERNSFSKKYAARR